MTPTGPVHFIHLGGSFHWQHARAIKTATVHDAPIWLWYADAIPPTPRTWDCLETNVSLRPLDLPDWLRDHPIQLANVKDLYAWRILHQHGGLYLDLDTISLAPVWDLLTRDVLVSLEIDPDDDYRNEHPYNSAAVAARKGAPVLTRLHDEAERLLLDGVAQWGSCGPRNLTYHVGENPDVFDVAPFGVMNGWRDGTIRRYYAGERPGPHVRIAHLFSSSNMGAFLADRWMPETTRVAA